MKSLGELKQGDTFAFIANIKGSDGTPLIGAAANLKSQIRDSLDNLKADLSIVEQSDTPGNYLFTAADTSQWDIGQYVLDIQLNNAGIITSSETMYVTITKDVTR